MSENSVNSDLHLQLLGGFAVSAGGALIPEAQWKSRRARSLVKLLALVPAHRLHRDQVIEALWPESDLAAAANNFHQTLHTARKILEAAGGFSLSLEEGFLTLSAASGYTLAVDVELFEAAAALAKNSQDPAVFQSALALYPGDLLPEDLYEEWTLPRREALKQVYLHLLLDLAQLYETRQDYPPAIEALLRLLESDRSREEAHAGLMRLYALSGQRQQALRQYQALRDALQAELDAEPGQATIDLYQAIQSGRFVPASSPGLFQENTTPRHNLPAQLTSFIGREKQIGEVRQLIQNQRLVTLTGSGGTGKTRLALKAAEGLLDAYADGVFLVELAPLSDPDLVPQACVKVLNVIEQSGVSHTDSLIHFLEKKDLLLIMDNCEHVIAACTRLADALLKGCPRLHILATSREILSVPGEHPFRVPSLTFPDPRHLPDLAETNQFEAVRLFVERAAQVAPGTALTASNAGAVVQIAQRLDGIPLAIELAAARVRMLTVEQIAARLDNTFRLLTGGSRAVLPRQQTLKAMIDWSYDLLSPKERLLLQRLSVFAGGWTLEAAETVCADETGDPDCSEGRLDSREVMDLMANLVDKSLVVAEPGEFEARYRLLETIRQYARERLLESGCSGQVRDRHLETFARLSGEAEPHLRGSGQVEWLERLDQELDNLRAALEWSLSGRVELGLKIAADLMWFWHLRSLFNGAFEWTKKLLEAETAQRGDLPLAGERALQRARGLRTLAIQASYLNNKSLEDRLAIFQESIAILRAFEHFPRRELGISLFFFIHYQGILFQPSLIREEMLEILRKENEQFYLSEYFFNMVIYAKDLDQAIEIENTSLAISREIEDLDGIGSRGANLGYLLMYKGDYIQAGDLIQKAVEISRKLKNYWWEAALHIRLSRLAMAQGKYAEAIHLAEAAVTKYRALNYLEQIHGPLQTLQQIAWSQGNYAASVQIAQENIATYPQQYPGRIIYLYLGRAAVSQGDLAQAEVHLRRALPSDAWRDWWNIPAIHILGWIALFRQQRKYPECARLIGVVDSIYRQVAPGLIPRERSEFEEDRAVTRAALGEEAFTAAFTEGQALTLEQALAWIAGEMQVVNE